MVCLLTPTVAASWIAERPRLRRMVPRVFSISGILYAVILSEDTSRQPVVLHQGHWYYYRTCVRFTQPPLSPHYWPSRYLASDSLEKRNCSALFKILRASGCQRPK